MPDIEMRVDGQFEQSLVPIQFNYLEIKSFLGEALSKYKGRVFDETEMAEAKKISADINRVAKQINDTRIQIKKQYLQKYEAFEEQCKELVALCNETNEGIKQQINAVAEARREAKLSLLEAFFKANCKGEAAEFLTWEKICDKRWGNATYSQTEAEQEILKQINITLGNLEIIREWNSEFEIELFEEFKNTLDIRTVFDKKRKLDAAKSEQEKRRAIVEQTREQKSLFDTTPPEPPKAEPVQTSAKVIELHMIAIGTKEQFLALRKAVDQIGMKMERVK